MILTNLKLAVIIKKIKSAGIVDHRRVSQIKRKPHFRGWKLIGH